MYMLQHTKELKTNETEYTWTEQNQEGKNRLEKGWIWHFCAQLGAVL